MHRCGKYKERAEKATRRAGKSCRNDVRYHCGGWYSQKRHIVYPGEACHLCEYLGNRGYTTFIIGQPSRAFWIQIRADLQDIENDLKLASGTAIEEVSTLFVPPVRMH